MTISLEIKAKALTSQLSKCESDINQAAQNLEKTFQSINDKTKQCGDENLPDPIKLIKRITALEIALNNLKQECSTISNRRFEIVQKVLSNQCQTVSRVKEILDRTEENDPYSSREDIFDETWDSMTRTLETQTNLLHISQDDRCATPQIYSKIK